MSQHQPRHYDTVHFPAYLDSGQSDVALSPALFSLPAGAREMDAPSPPEATEISAPPAQDPTRPWLVSAYSRICDDMLGVGVRHAEFPGGDHRASCRLVLADGRRVIASRRETAGRAQLEHAVLTHLHSHNAPVPGVIGFNGLVLLQQDLPGTKLATLLDGASEADFEKHLGAALDSLTAIHRIAETTGLDRAVPIIGSHPDWLLALLDRTAVIGGYLGIPCPFLPVDALFDLLEVLKPRFVKWDARPGNAMIAPNGEACWFDWEHCGARNRLDDMAWLLCDESLPSDHPEAEERLIDRYLPLFADGRSTEEAHCYLRVYGVLHFCVRLGRLLDACGNGGWEQADAALEKSTPGASRAEALRLVTRAQRWAERTDYTRMLSGWFADVAQRLQTV